MKRIFIFFILMTVFHYTSFAQEILSKKGERYLPEQGEWAIGIDAVPVVNFLGNIFRENSSAISWNYTNPNLLITGKYFKTANIAYRTGVRVGFNNVIYNKEVDNRSINNWPEETMVSNKSNIIRSNLGLTLGVEYRKGKTRLQGYYGAETGVYFSNSATKYKYGNKLTLDDNSNSVDVSHDDILPGITPNVLNIKDGMGIYQLARVLKYNSGYGISLGLRAFVGAEYFVLPKLSIGGEFGWGVGLSVISRSKTEYELKGYRSGTDQRSVETINVKGTGITGFGFDSDVLNSLFGYVGRMNITFHF